MQTSGVLSCLARPQEFERFPQTHLFSARHSPLSQITRYLICYYSHTVHYQNIAFYEGKTPTLLTMTLFPTLGAPRTSRSGGRAEPVSLCIF